MVLSYHAWRAKYVRPYRDSLYVYYDANNDAGHDVVCCSEAQGYGLLSSCLAGMQQDFDAFLRYTEMFVNSRGLMGWQQVENNGKIVPADDGGKQSATDGDLDIAYALFMAAEKWRNPAYRARALEFCKSLWTHCVNKELYTLRLGDWVETGSSFDKLTRPSDFILTHLLAFGYEDVERREGWLHVLNNAIDILLGVLRQHPSGLVPDFLEYRRHEWRAPKGRVLESPLDNAFYWNACRVPWRIAVYYFQTKDPRVLPILHAQLDFFEKQAEIKTGYTLSGRPIHDYQDVAFLGPVSYLFWLFNSPRFPSLWNQMVALEENTYYGDTITLLCTLQAQ